MLATVVNCQGAVLYDFGSLRFSTPDFLPYGFNYIQYQEMLSCTGVCGALGLGPVIAPGPNGAKTYEALPFEFGGIPTTVYEVPTDLQHFGTFGPVSVSPWEGPVSAAPEPASVGLLGAALSLFGLIAWKRRVGTSSHITAHR